MIECNICETEVSENEYLEIFISNFNKQEYKLYECSNCKLQWWEPLKIIPEFYEQEGEEGYIVFHLGLRKKMLPNQRKFINRFKNNPGKLLDVGCGDGIFLKEAQKYGFEVWGIDIDRKSINSCQARFGLKNTFAMSLDEFVVFAKENGLRFDYITFFEVLEHQDNPRRFLEDVKKLLKDGGYIAGSVPNRDSYIVILNGRKCGKSDYPPHHFLRFNIVALENAFIRAGFKEFYCTTIKSGLEEFPITGQYFLLGTLDGIRKVLTGSEQPTIAYFKQTGLKKVLLNFLRKIRDTVFFVPGFIVVLFSKELYLYFEAKK